MTESSAGIATNEQEVESFDPWYINYSVGVPTFAQKLKDRLIAFENYDHANEIGLVTAVCNRQIEMMHDITQDYFDEQQVEERDRVMTILSETIPALVKNDMHGFVLGTPQELRIRYACALCFNKADMLDSQFLEQLNGVSEEIDEIVAVTTAIIKLV